MALQAGVHPKMVGARLGHSNICVTMNTHLQVIKKMQAESDETVAVLIIGGAG